MRTIILQGIVKNYRLESYRVAKEKILYKLVSRDRSFREKESGNNSRLFSSVKGKSS
jgi:hypothetical protein